MIIDFVKILQSHVALDRRSYGLHQTFAFFLLEYEISHKTFEVIDDNNSAQNNVKIFGFV